MEFRVKSVCELSPQNCDFFCSACDCPDPEPLQVVKQFIAYLYAALLLLMLPTMLALCSHCYYAAGESIADSDKAKYFSSLLQR